MSARDRHLANRLQLEILISQTVRKFGGTGCALDPDQYIAEQVKQWSNTREALVLAMACFTDIKEGCIGTPMDVPGKAERQRIKGRYDWMADKAAERCRLGEEKQKATQQTNGGDGWLVSGVTRSR